MRADYNAKSCADKRKAAGARTMRAMEKTMRGAMETMKNPGADLRPVVTPEDRHRAAYAWLPDEPNVFVGSVDEPGRASQRPVSAITTIGKRAQQRNHVLCRDLARLKSKARPKR